MSACTYMVLAEDTRLRNQESHHVSVETGQTWWICWMLSSQVLSMEVACTIFEVKPYVVPHVFSRFVPGLGLSV